MKTFIRCGLVGIFIFYASFYLAAQTCLPSGITFDSQIQIDNFSTNYPNCTIIQGSVWIIPAGTITNLNGLSQLTEIQGNLTISGNASLPNLTGLDNLTTIGGSLLLTGNSSITSLIALSNLNSIGGRLDIGNNNALVDLTGLENVNVINDNLSINLNDNLIDLSGLDNISSIAGQLYVRDNPALINLNGLDNVTSIGGNFRIENNDDMIDLSGLENLTTIDGEFLIRINDKLESLNGLNNLHTINDNNFELELNIDLVDISALSNLTNIGSGFILVLDRNHDLTTLTGLENLNVDNINFLILANNNLLSDCATQSICDYLDDPNNNANIVGNDPGCNNRTEVEEACDGPLPLEIQSFTAQKADQNVRLSWHTASESNHAGFDLQHSTDGHSWDKLDFIESKGNTDTGNDYDYLHRNPVSGTNYYRLKMIDLDGTFEYSGVISVELGQEGPIRIFPNPTTGIVHIQGMETGEVRILNSIGSQVKTVPLVDQEIDLKDLPNGLYYCSVRSGSQVFSEKIIKR